MNFEQESKWRWRASGWGKEVLQNKKTKQTNTPKGNKKIAPSQCEKSWKRKRKKVSQIEQD